MQTVREAWKALDRRTALVFLVAALAGPTWYFHFGIPQMERLLGDETGRGVLRDLAPPAASYAAMFALLAVVPAMLGMRLLGDRLRDYGVGLGDVRYGIRATLVLLPVFVIPAILGGPRMPEMAEVYPLSRAALVSTRHFVLYEALYLVFYVAWEFHFRGFLLLGAEKAIGAMPALGLSIVTTALMHLAKPPGEFYASVFAGVVWGWLVLRTRSFVWPLVIHYLSGIANDVTVSLHFHDFSFGS